MAVDGISRVFELQVSPSPFLCSTSSDPGPCSQGPTPRNDFCRIFTQEGLLEPLSSALLHVAIDDDDLAESAKAKIVHIFLLFAQADRKVKEAMANRAVVLRGSFTLFSGPQVAHHDSLAGLVKAIGMLDPELLAPLLKTIKNLSMLPSALEVLQNANAIDSLVRILAEPFEGKLAAVRFSSSSWVWCEADFETHAGDSKPHRQRSL